MTHRIHRSEAARAILLCCRRLWQAGLIDLVEVGPDESRLDGSRQATTELDLHLRIYGCRRDCGAVVRAHPPVATAFSVAGEGIPANVLPEI